MSFTPPSFDVLSAFNDKLKKQKNPTKSAAQRRSTRRTIEEILENLRSAKVDNWWDDEND